LFEKREEIIPVKAVRSAAVTSSFGRRSPKKKRFRKKALLQRALAAISAGRIKIKIPRVSKRFGHEISTPGVLALGNGNRAVGIAL
jgi:hypothetical protein